MKISAHSLRPARASDARPPKRGASFAALAPTFAHAKDSTDAIDWASLAAERQTLAVYMGVAGLESLRERLIAHGRAASTPFALIENGSRPEQRVVVGTLDRLPALARAHAVQSPALLVLGEVAALAGTLHWFGAAPLGDVEATEAPVALEQAA